MTQEPVLVHVDMRGTAKLVGRLWPRVRKGRESASFEYDAGWLREAERFALEPALTLAPGPHHTAEDKALFGAIGDSAPDRWGRTLMRRAERRRAEKEGRTPRTLLEIDYLLLVDDEARPGALRFAIQPGGPFMAAAGASRIPPFVELSRLLSASTRVVSATDSDADLMLLLAPGSSLGGARPKASVRDKDGHLAFAKFPRPDDEIDRVSWEALALTLAARAGIRVPEWRLETVARKPVLLQRRFDRMADRRIPFLSALSMLTASDNETHSYLEMVDALRQHGAAAAADARELWRRVVFNILISNTDDHLRNHGFLHVGPEGWRLSPAYDLNPVPTDIGPRVLATAIDLEDTTASLETAMQVAAYFGLDPPEARRIAAEVGKSVRGWRRAAARLGMRAGEIDRMASAFEHSDLTQATT